MKKLLLAVVCLLVSVGANASHFHNLHLSLKSSCRIFLPAECRLQDVDRISLNHSLAHYTIKLKVGDGEFDSIVLHRVVKEHAPWLPVRTRSAVMMLHGDAWGFEPAFLASANSAVVDADHSIAIKMAADNIDVWGVDMRWIHVPATTPDLSFMQNWDLSTDLDDLGVAVSVARSARWFGGNGYRPLSLLGWSRGSQLGYLYLARESQLPFFWRNIDGYVSVDAFLKTDSEASRQAACLRSAATQAEIDAGKFHNDTGLLIQTGGALAQLQPDQPSPLFPGLTNLQAILLFGAATHALAPPGASPTPWYHHTGGLFDQFGLPAGLSFTHDDYFIELTTRAAPYQPNNIYLQGDIIVCDEIDSPYDDHIDDIRVPILYVYAAGGFGAGGSYSAQLTASPDVTSIGVQTLPPELAALDFGHIDLFAAGDADEMIWQDIIDWIKAH